MHSQEIIDDVLREYRRTRSPFKTSRATGIGVNDVWNIINDHQDKLGPFEQRWGGDGRPELRPYVVAKRQANDSSWDNTLPEIAQARQDYEAGTHEMCTGRDGSVLILYSIPRRTRDPRPDYFKPELS
ncbi:MAG: hypothetical protein ACTHJR_11610 [Sphingomonas sp.]|uniref:hypothetical protein n=1 Tax=Sphingomonas sp. TaxID=28214 RepID=UPI003F820CF7